VGALGLETIGQLAYGTRKAKMHADGSLAEFNVI
jgi:hypothetical protein